MKFQFFESLSDREAREYLEDFLRFGRERGMKLLGSSIHFTVDLDYRLESLAPVLKEVATSARTIPRKDDESLPEWIRATELHEKSLFDFTEPSTILILAAAYYLGETFVQNFKKLCWSTGNKKFAEGNMPVVTGFKGENEMAPLLIAENLIGGVISGIRDEDSIDTAISVWTTKYL